MARKSDPSLFEDPEEAAYDERSAVAPCTPEALLRFIGQMQQTQGRQPTLAECKAEFGGLLGVLTSLWELDRRGLIPRRKK